MAAAAYDTSHLTQFLGMKIFWPLQVFFKPDVSKRFSLQNYYKEEGWCK
jgi:hypothetical protein